MQPAKVLFPMQRAFFQLPLLIGICILSLSDPIKGQTIGHSPSNLLGQIGTIGQQGRINTITTAVPFLLIGPDARAGALGNTGVSTKPDRNAPHWNGSKLAFIEDKGGGGLSYVPWSRNLMNDIYLAHASGYYKLNEGSVIGASAKYFSLGEVRFTDRRGNEIRTYEPREFMVQLNYSQKLGEKFAAGIPAKYIHSDLTGGTSISGSASPGRAPAMDLSFFY